MQKLRGRQKEGRGHELAVRAEESVGLLFRVSQVENCFS